MFLTKVNVSHANQNMIDLAASICSTHSLYKQVSVCPQSHPGQPIAHITTLTVHSRHYTSRSFQIITYQQPVFIKCVKADYPILSKFYHNHKSSKHHLALGECTGRNFLLECGKVVGLCI